MALLPAARARSPPAGSAQSHLVIEHHVIADLRRLTDHNAGSVIDEKAFPNLCPGMNLDTSCNETGKLRNQAWQKRNRRLVKSVSDAMIEDRPQPLVEQRLKDIATGGGSLARKSVSSWAVRHPHEALSSLGGIGHTGM